MAKSKGRRQVTSQKTKTSFTIPDSLRKRLKHAAIDEGRDMTELVIDALEAYLAKTQRVRAE